MQEEVLSIPVKRNTPRVRDAELCMTRELFGARAVAEEATVGGTHRPVNRLHVAVQKHALGHVNRPGGIHAKRRDRVVRIVIVKPAQQHFLGVVLIIAIGVAQENKAAALRHVYTIMRDFKPHRDVQVTGKYRLLVGLSVVVRVLQDQQLILRLRIADAVVRIARHRSHP